MSAVRRVRSEADEVGRSLLTDPKARKVILIEHPLLPLYIKEMLARILFENLQVRAPPLEVRYEI